MQKKCTANAYFVCLFYTFKAFCFSFTLRLYTILVLVFYQFLKEKKLLYNGCRYPIFINILLIIDTILLLQKKKRNSQKRHQIYIPFFFLIEMSQSVKKYSKKSNSIQLTLLSCQTCFLPLSLLIISTILPRHFYMFATITSLNNE